MRRITNTRLIFDVARPKSRKTDDIAKTPVSPSLARYGDILAFLLGGVGGRLLAGDPVVR
jgi:hypothetical protein